MDSARNFLIGFLTVLFTGVTAANAATLTLSADAAESNAKLKAVFTPDRTTAPSETFSVVSSHPAAAVVPSTITSEGGAPVSFTIATGVVTADAAVLIEVRQKLALPGAAPFASAKLRVLAPPAIRALSVTPTALTAGGTATGTVALVRAAEFDGVVVRLSSSNSAAAAPQQVVIPPRAGSANFTISTSAVASVTSVTVTASSGQSTASTSLTVRPAPAIASLTLPASIVSGAPPANADVALASAMTEPVVVNLQSSSPNLQVPASVTVPAGFLGVGFQVSGTGVSFGAAQVQAQLTASASGSSRTASTAIQPSPAPQILSLEPVTLRTINAPSGPRRLVLRNEPMRITLSGPGAAKASVRETTQSAFSSTATAAIPPGATSVVATYVGPSGQFEGDRLGFVRIYSEAGADLGTRSFNDLYFFDIRPVITASAAIDLVVLPGDGNVVIPGQRMSIDGTGFRPQGTITSGNLPLAVTIDGQQAQVVSSSPTRLEVVVPNVSNCFGVKPLSVHNGVEPNSSQASPVAAISLTIPCPEVTSVVPEAVDRSVGTGNFVIRVRGDYLGKMNPTISVNGVNGTVVPVSQNEVEVLFPRTITSGAVVASTPYGNSGTAAGFGNSLTVTD